MVIPSWESKHMDDRPPGKTLETSGLLSPTSWHGAQKFQALTAQSFDQVGKPSNQGCHVGYLHHSETGIGWLRQLRVSLKGDPKSHWSAILEISYGQSHADRLWGVSKMRCPIASSELRM